MYNQIFKLIRQYYRLSESDLALRIGLTRQAITSLEKEGKYKPSISTLERYAKHFALRVSDLIWLAEELDSRTEVKPSVVSSTSKRLNILEWAKDTSKEIEVN